MPLYDGPIIDPHHHLWDLGLKRHPWLGDEAGTKGGLGDLGPLKRDYLPADYRRDAGRQNIVATVHVEAGWTPDEPDGETAWLDSLDATHHVACRYIAHVPLAAPDATERLKRSAAHPRIVGIRDILSWHPDPSRSFAARGDLMDDPAWRAGLRRLGELGLTFDLMLFPWQLADACRLASAFPDVTFVLNHCGSPIERDALGMARWRDGLRALARAPNVAIKISDLVAYDNDWTLESLRAVTLHCIDCFGPDRSMFASDFPVAGLHATFEQVWDGFKEIVGDLTSAEQRALFFANARQLYRLTDVGTDVETERSR